MHLFFQPVAQTFIAEPTPVTARNLVPLAPAVRGIAAGAEDGLDIGERYFARRGDPELERLEVFGHVGDHHSNVAPTTDIRSGRLACLDRNREYR